MAQLFRIFGLLALLGLGVFFWLTRPDRIDDIGAFTALTADQTRGEDVFHAAGCASCHVAPDASLEGMPVLAGGQGFASDFGVFYAPNISPDPDQGIGGWSLENFANAVLRGVSPGGQHYYPAFPYTSYGKMQPQDLVDLKAYMDQLPQSDTPNRPHDVGFPFNYRRALGGWKLLFAQDSWVMSEVASEQQARGRYLVEALGHCGECHTPRNAMGGLKRQSWLQGAVLPGEGKVPALTPDLLQWSAEDIAFYLESGFTPDFDSAGGAMAHVVENISKLSPEDREAIAAYLIALP